MGLYQLSAWTRLIDQATSRGRLGSPSKASRTLIVLKLFEGNVVYLWLEVGLRLFFAVFITRRCPEVLSEVHLSLCFFQMAKKPLTYKEKSGIAFIAQDDPPFIKEMKKKSGFKEPPKLEDKVLSRVIAVVRFPRPERIAEKHDCVAFSSRKKAHPISMMFKRNCCA